MAKKSKKRDNPDVGASRREKNVLLKQRRLIRKQVMRQNGVSFWGTLKIKLLCRKIKYLR